MAEQQLGTFSQICERGAAPEQHGFGIAAAMRKNADSGQK
jgi:hypothetical protein